MLEPRRLAARAAAARMAMTLREEVGETVGYRVRFGSKISRATRIEVVTEGVFTRRVLDDPGLEGVAALLFDEFHERSLDADLGLALARDVQTGLREDLRLVVMSATLDGARVARLLADAPVIESSGRAFAVETRYLGRDPRAPIERQVVDAILQAIRERGRLGAGVPARRRRNPPRRAQLRERIADPAVDIVAALRRARRRRRRIAPSRPRRPAGARSCWPPRSRKPRSPSRACGSWSTAGWRGCRATSRTSGSRAWRPCGSRAPPPISGAAAPGAPRPASATACGRRRRPPRSKPPTGPKSWPPICPASCSISPIGACAIRPRSIFSTRRRRPRVAEAKALLAELGAARRAGAHHAGRPAAAAIAVAAAARPHGGRCGRAPGKPALAADIAVVLTERGLGGNDVDLAHRLDGLRHDRSRGRARRARWRSAGPR